MSNTNNRLYIDTCCFVDVAQYEAQIRRRELDEDNVWFMKALLEAAKDNKIDLFTSTITIAECTHAKEPNELSDGIKDLIKRILTSGVLIKLIDADYFVTEKARDLRWNNGLNLKGADLIHIASALECNCSEILTNDRFRHKEESNIEKIEKLGLKVRHPKETSYLPQDYRQEKMFKKNDEETEDTTGEQN